MFKKYFLSTRPWSFPVSAMSVLVTASFLFWRGWGVDWAMVIWAVLGIILFHAAGNLLSDWYDYKKGIDAADTFGSKTLTDGVLSSKQVLVFGIILLVIATLNGLAISYVAGPWLLLIGGFGALFTIAYPFMKSHAMGDLCIFLEYGIIPAIGTAYTVNVFRSTLDWGLYIDALWAVPAFASITIAVLHTNNTRDCFTDKRAGIRTFAMLIGKEHAIALYCIEIILPIVWTTILACVGIMPYPAALMLALYPAVISRCKQAIMYEKDDQAMNNLDERTAQLQLINGLLLTTILIVSRFIF